MNSINRIFLFFICLSFSTLHLNSQNYDEYGLEIEKSLKKCMNNPENISTAGSLACISVAYDDWDKELNRVYKDLRNILNDDEQKLLRNSQIKWIDYRDREFDFINELYGNLQGTMFLIFGASKKMEIVKARCIELNNYYKDKTEFDE